MDEKSKIYSNFDEGSMYHFITIKPNPDCYKDGTMLFKRLLEYYKSKNVNYWIREVKSPNDFLHMHGIITYNFSGDKFRSLKTIQKWINRNIGYYTVIPIQGKVDDVISYIKDPQKNILCREAHSKSLLLIEA